MKHVIASITTGGCLLLAAAGMASAGAGNPSGTGQPGAPNVGCTVTANALQTPGNAAMSSGSPFDEPGTNANFPLGGIGGQNYANSTTPGSHAISQYDVACYQLSNPPPTLP
jgi:hypothetical protein